MKKLVLLFLSLLLVALPITVQAMPAPLARVSSNVKVLEDSTVQVISYDVYMKAESQVTETTATLVLKNTSEDTKAGITLGIPSYLNRESIRVNQAQLVMDGDVQRLTSRRDRTKQEDTSFIDLPKNWLAWAVELQPGEHKVITISYNTENQVADDGTQTIYVPLEYTKAWFGAPANIQVVVDIENGLPYMLKHDPTFLPHEYDGKGKLIWRYKNTLPPASILVSYGNIENLAVDYLTARASGDRSLNNIIKAYANKSYDTVLTLIPGYLEEQPETPWKNELMYLLALSHQGLYQIDEGLSIFNHLEESRLFGDMEETFKNRITYDKYNHMVSLLADKTELYNYMDSARNYVMDNAMFLMWIERELDTLELPPTPQPPTPAPEAPSKETDPVEEKGNEELITTIQIGGYEIPVEAFFLGILVVIVLLILIFRKKNNKRNKGYLFR